MADMPEPPEDPEKTEADALDPSSDDVTTTDPLVEEIEENGEPSGGNFA